MTRVFLGSKNRVDRGKDPGGFMIATCHQVGHILISNKDKCDKIDLKWVTKA